MPDPPPPPPDAPPPDAIDTRPRKRGRPKQSKSETATSDKATHELIKTLLQSMSVFYLIIESVVLKKHVDVEDTVAKIVDSRDSTSACINLDTNHREYMVNQIRERIVYIEGTLTNVMNVLQTQATTTYEFRDTKLKTLGMKEAALCIGANLLKNKVDAHKITSVKRFYTKFFEFLGVMAAKCVFNISDSDSKGQSLEFAAMFQAGNQYTKDFTFTPSPGELVKPFSFGDIKFNTICVDWMKKKGVYLNPVGVIHNEEEAEFEQKLWQKPEPKERARKQKPPVTRGESDEEDEDPEMYFSEESEEEYGSSQRKKGRASDPSTQSKKGPAKSTTSTSKSNSGGGEKDPIPIDDTTETGYTKMIEKQTSALGKHLTALAQFMGTTQHKKVKPESYVPVTAWKQPEKDVGADDGGGKRKGKAPDEAKGGDLFSRMRTVWNAI